MRIHAINVYELLKTDLQEVSDPIKRYKSDMILKSFLKKLPSDSPELLEEQCEVDFIQRNDKVANFVLSSEFTDSLVFQTWKSILYSFFTDWNNPSIISLDSSLQEGLLGPGSNLGSKSNDFYTKMFDSDLTFTNTGLYKRYVNVISGSWSIAELLRSDKHRAVCVTGSKFASVPKDTSRNRAIAIEPSLNMFFQLGMKSIINRRLEKRYNLHISRDMSGFAPQQEVNKNLAKFGSIDGSLSTIDLKDASDMISLQLCEALLPKEVYRDLCAVRSTYISIKSKDIKLASLSTMGNGFTFSFMTVLLHTLMVAVASIKGIQLTNGINVGTYGDDMICPSEIYPDVCDTIEQAGLIVNREKSFSTGFFRESCGGDFYLGHNVRGIYLKTLLERPEHVYSIFNRLLHWSTINDIYIDNALIYLQRLAKFQPVPMDCADVAGFKFPSHLLISPKVDRNGSLYYKGFVARPRRMRIGENCNFPGAVICVIGGYIRRGYVDVRTDNISYTLKKCVTPSWDYSSFSDLESQVFAATWMRILIRI